MKKTVYLLLALLLLTCALSACGKDTPESAGPIYAEHGDIQREALGSLAPAADAGAVLSSLASAGQGVSANWQAEELETPVPALVILNGEQRRVQPGKHIFWMNQ